MDLEFILFTVAVTAGVALFSYLVYSFRPARRDVVRVSRRKGEAEEPPRYF